MNIKYHMFHIVSLSPFPLVMGLYSLAFFNGTLMMFKEKFSEVYILTLLLATILFMWWMNVSLENYLGNHTFVVKDGFKMGMALFIFSEVMFFFAWFWAFFHNSLTPSNEMGSVWPPYSLMPMEPFQIPMLNTIVLLSSGITVTMSHESLISSLKQDSENYLLMTILLGMFFTYLQYTEYHEASFNISDNSYGSSFFVTTGFHGLHVLIGTIFLSYCFFYMKKNFLTSWQHTSYEFAIWYWHFVDVVWIFLYLFLYWWSF